MIHLPDVMAFADPPPIALSFPEGILLMSVGVTYSKKIPSGNDNAEGNQVVFPDMRLVRAGAYGQAGALRRRRKASRSVCNWQMTRVTWPDSTAVCSSR